MLATDRFSKLRLIGRFRFVARITDVKSNNM